MSRQFEAAGHDVRVVTAMPHYPSDTILPGYRRKLRMTEDFHGVEVRRIWNLPASGRGSKRFVSFATFLPLGGLRSLTLPKADILFIESPPLTTGLLGILLGHRKGRKVVLNVADLWTDAAVELGSLTEGSRGHRALAKLESTIYSRVDQVIAVTEGVKDGLLAKGVPEEKIGWLPNGVDIDTFHPERPGRRPAELRDIDAPLFVFPGNIGYISGLDVVIEAMALLKAEGSDIHFAFIGDGSERERLEEASRSRSLTNIRFVDPVPPEQIADLLPTVTGGVATLADLPISLMVRPSKVFPMLATATPVVYSGKGEGAALVADHGAGVVVEPGDPAALAAAMQRVAAGGEDIEQMGRNGRQLAVDRFSWAALISDWMASLEE
ncbi:MAG: colanic acid biosynthesis glycosyl transferase WcaI [Acidimicrobiales bacterium]|jgi:colanic acid biosynthesis glycosyl transferase WcaI